MLVTSNMSHAYAVVSEGAFTRDGELLQLASIIPAAVMEVFRRLQLGRPHQAERHHILRKLNYTRAWRRSDAPNTPGWSESMVRRTRQESAPVC